MGVEGTGLVASCIHQKEGVEQIGCQEGIEVEVAVQIVPLEVHKDWVVHQTDSVVAWDIHLVEKGNSVLLVVAFFRC